MKHLIVPAICIAALWLTSCTTVTTETIHPDGSKTTTTSTSVDPATATAIANAAANAALEKSRDSGK